jgi:hypothetical protein
MYIFKFQDIVEGNFAFILAPNQSDAEVKLGSLTELKFKLITAKPVTECGTWVIFNKIKEIIY